MMQKTVRLVIAALLGFVVGSVTNMAIVVVGPILIPPPPGVDMSTMQSLAETIHLMGPLNFAAPFLAHALGTLSGVFVCCLLAGARRNLLAGILAVLFLAGGIAASTMIPAPLWFIAMDLLLAYLPMAWLGLLLANRLKPISNSHA
jgi:hypothetical protein